MKIGLVLGLINEKMNQMSKANVEDVKEDKDEIVHGDANMLMNM
jgi:hypothetical protein